MSHRRWLHAVAAVTTLVVVLATLQNLHPQAVVVDPRPWFPMPAAVPAVSIPVPALDDGICRIHALGGVLEELSSRINYLQTETLFLKRDANSLWSGWRGVFGIQHSFLRLNIAGPSVAVSDGSQEQRVQTEIFSLYSNAHHVDARMRGLEQKLRRAEERWRILSRLRAAASAENDPGVADGINELRISLSKIVDEANALDEDVRSVQHDLDRLYPQMAQLVGRDAPNSIALSQPWHWSYMATGKPRPTLRYDFDLRYGQELERARENMAKRSMNE